MTSENPSDLETIIKNTQDTLGKYIKKPGLTEKLLRKPPFRFLHDVIHAVIKETGYFEGLYTKEELNSENIKDRDGKISFLQKIIDVLKISTEQKISVRPSKIVSGQEPEKTNEFLQLIAEVITNNVDCKNAIETVKGNNEEGQKPSPSGAVKSKKKDVSPEKKKVESSSRTKEHVTDPAVKDKNKSKSKGDTEKGNAPKTSSKKNVNGDHKDKVKGSTEKKKPSPEKKEKLSSKNSGASPEKKSRPKDEKKSKVKKEKQTRREDEKELNSLVVKDGMKKDALKSVNESGNSKQDEKKEKETRRNSRKNSAPTENDNLENPERDIMNNEVAKVSLPTSEQVPPIVLMERKSSSGKSRQSSSNNKSRNRRKSNENTDSSISNLKREAEEESPQNIAKSRKNSVDKSSIIEIDNGSNSYQSMQSDKDRVSSQASHYSKKSERIPSSTSGGSSVPLSSSEIKRQSTFVREDSSKDMQSTGRPRTSLRPPSVRPASARPGAPRRRDRNVEIILQPNDSIKMAGINVKVESFSADLEDDGENLVVIENTDIHEQQTVANSKSEMGANSSVLLENVDNVDQEQQGHLVQQILETQKELIQNSSTDQKDKTTDLIAWDSLQKRQSSAKQMNSLRDIIQNLTRSVNPLGKLMDFIPEDIDSMQLELIMWRDNYLQAASDLKKEQSLTDSAIEPLKNQLQEIDGNIKEYLELIDTNQGKILTNYDKIQKLLTE